MASFYPVKKEGFERQGGVNIGAYIITFTMYIYIYIYHLIIIYFFILFIYFYFFFFWGGGRILFIVNIPQNPILITKAPVCFGCRASTNPLKPRFCFLQP